MFAGTFAPRNWALCEGQLLAISQYSNLFSVLGTTYGGDGRSSFALPDLRGRGPIHAGQSPTLSSYALGQQGGQETVTLTETHLPTHTHPLQSFAGSASEESPVNGYPATTATDSYAATPDSTMGDTSPTGRGQAHENRPPYLAIYFIICLEGLYPSRN